MSFEPKDNKTAKIHGHSVSVPCPYIEGHTLTAAEAEALNSHFVDGVRARVASQVKDVEDVYTVQEIVKQAAFDYTFGERGGRSADPVQTEAMNIARNIVREQLRKKGYNLSEVKDKQVSELAKQVLSKNPQIKERARSVVEERNAMAAEIEL